MSSKLIYNECLTDYILSLYDNDEVNDKASLLKQEIKTLDEAISVFNSLLEYIKKKTIDQEISKSLKFIKDQYKLLGLEKFIKIKYLTNILTLFLYRYNINYQLSAEEKVNLIKNCIKDIDSYEDTLIKNDIYNICLRYIVENNLITNDKSFTKNILSYCVNIKEEEKYLTILPNELLSL